MRKKLGLFFITLILIVIVYNLVARIFVALKAGDRITKAVQELNQVEIKNAQLKKQLSQVASSDFIETQARNKLGLAKEGETVIVIPQDKIEAILGAAKKIDEIRLPNYLGWFKLFFQ